MGFAMRVNYVPVISDGTLRNEYVRGQRMGYAFDVRLSYYRGHFLSDIDVLELTVDGQRVPDEYITFCLNGRELSVWEAKNAATEFWRLLDPATIKVWCPGGLQEGEHHLELNLMLRVPYLPLGGDADSASYMPLNCGGENTMPVIL